MFWVFRKEAYKIETQRLHSRSPLKFFDPNFVNLLICHCEKSVRIRSYSGPYFPAFGLNTERYSYSVRMRENTDQNTSEYGHFLPSASIKEIWSVTLFLTWSPYGYFLAQKITKWYSGILNHPIQGIICK